MLAKLESLDSVKATFTITPIDNPHAINTNITVARRYWEQAGMPTTLHVDFYNNNIMIEWGEKNE